MLYLNANEDADRVRELRQDDPHGRRSTGELERQVLAEKLARKVSDVADEDLRDILETILDLIG